MDNRVLKLKIDETVKFEKKVWERLRQMVIIKKVSLKSETYISTYLLISREAVDPLFDATCSFAACTLADKEMLSTDGLESCERDPQNFQFIPKLRHSFKTIFYCL